MPLPFAPTLEASQPPAPRQLPLPLAVPDPMPRLLPSDLATLSPPQIWPTLAPPLQAQVRLTLLHIIQEVLADDAAPADR
jgi:hypothetical protein